MHLMPRDKRDDVFKLSKLLHQEDALGVPCFHGDFCSPQASRGAWEYCDGLISRF
jgi:hypothetical protein